MECLTPVHGSKSESSSYTSSSSLSSMNSSQEATLVGNEACSSEHIKFIQECKENNECNEKLKPEHVDKVAIAFSADHQHKIPVKTETSFSHENRQDSTLPSKSSVYQQLFRENAESITGSRISIFSIPKDKRNTTRQIVGSMKSSSSDKSNVTNCLQVTICDSMPEVVKSSTPVNFEKRKFHQINETKSDSNAHNPMNSIQRSLICEILPLNIFFHALLRKRGYSKQNYSSLETAYFNKPTPYQQASYGATSTQAARSGDAHTLCKLIKCGLSRNPCNKFNESLIHIICRRGRSRNSFEVLKMMFKMGSEFQVCDDFGRTPLHDAFWTVDLCFDTISLLLEVDVNLLRMKDCRGSTPFDYVRKNNQRKVIEYLLVKKDIYWPQRHIVEGDEPPHILMTLPPHSRIIPDPKNALSLDLASLVANGKMDPEKVMLLHPEDRKSYRQKNKKPLNRPLLFKRKKIGQL